MFSYGLLHINVPVFVNQQRHIYISSVQVEDAALKICYEWWMIEMDGEKESGNFVLSAWLGDDVESSIACRKGEIWELLINDSLKLYFVLSAKYIWFMYGLGIFMWVALWIECLPMVWETRAQSQFESYQGPKKCY